MQKSLQKNRNKKPQECEWERREKHNVSSGAYVDHV